MVQRTFFYHAANKRSVWNRVSKLFHPRVTKVITQQCEGRTSYVMWLFRDMLHSIKLKSFSSINFSLFTKCIRVPYFGDPDVKQWAQRIEVNDDEYSLFMALRLGYVTYNVWSKTPECLFRLREASKALSFSPGLSLVAFYGSDTGKWRR